MLNKIIKTPKARILFFAIIVIVGGLIALSLYLQNTSESYLQSKVSKAPENLSKKAYLNDEYYQKLHKQQQSQEIKQAKENGLSYVNIDNSKQSEQPEPLAKAINPRQFHESLQQTNRAPAQKTTGYRQFGNNVNQLDSPVNDTAIQQKIADKESALQKSMQDLMKSWQHEPMMVHTELPAPENGSSSTASNNGGSVLIKAGEIVFAVIDTAVNSDQAGTPVMASIVSGSLNGAKLLGSFKLVNDRLVIEFSRLSIPQYQRSITIQSYAIDAKTAQTALASDVDHHYLTRYASLFASGFLQGFGQYYSSYYDNGYGNDWQSFWLDNGYRPPPSTRDAAYSGLGEIGLRMADNAQTYFNRPPTVTLDQGTGVGILFTSDVTTNTQYNNQQFKQYKQAISPQQNSGSEITQQSNVQQNNKVKPGESNGKI
ncbi:MULTISPECIES: DotG/IcmE/VirB10 family protein [Cysteiniphilum]|uniref:DotG/IcmE/VirB10 family protein n=1 Tax=Cysteiniphilum TaxID=2056696 RepID=UPI00177B00C4|nr:MULTISPECIES: DotG/IcmE/VirB10 family protein [Cysteiniphilum]